MRKSRRLVPLLAVSITATLAPALVTSTATAARAASPSASSLSASSPSSASPSARKGARPPRPRSSGAPRSRSRWTTGDPRGERIDLVVSRIKAAAPGTGDVLPHLTTRNTARDMDLLRAVLGEKKMIHRE